ncbi:pyruvate kinase alpha/beta domain-containing protein [Chloroflexota bacterium]
MSEKSIWYFLNPGEQNTEQALSLAKTRALEIGIKHIAVASTTGGTALKAIEAFSDTDIKVVIVSHQYGFNTPGGKHPMSPDNMNKIKELNATLVISTLPLSSPARLFRDAMSWKSSPYTLYNTTFPTDIISDTLRMFSQGIKVCVESAVIAADAGAIPIDKDIVAVAGTRRGADTAVVIKPAHMTNIFNLKIREIIAMPNYIEAL